MNDLLSKLSSYDIFNNLLPGIVFVALADQVTDYTFIQTNILVGLFVYYFIGLVISRIGSLILEPILRRSAFVKFASYSDFITASQRDTKIELLSEKNNSYRTLCAAVLLVGLLWLYQIVESLVPVLSKYSASGLIVILLVIFLFSYRKQTEYVARRVELNKGKE